MPGPGFSTFIYNSLSMSFLASLPNLVTPKCFYTKEFSFKLYLGLYLPGPGVLFLSALEMLNVFFKLP